MYRIEIENKGAYLFNARSGDYECTIEMQGKSGMKPLEAFLAAAGSCVGVYVRKYIEGTKLQIEGFGVSVKAELTSKPPFRFNSIDVSINLGGVDIDEMRKRSLLEFVKNCPVHNTLSGGAAIKYRISGAEE